MDNGPEGHLEKQVGLMGVFSVAAGAMISSGLFILPAIAYAKAGPAVILSYLIASLLIIPSVYSKAELATAMPKSGGTYFFVERSVGPFGGVFSGLASWFSLALKTAFAIVGLSVLATIFVEQVFGIQLGVVQQKAIAVICCVAFGVLNLVSVKHTAGLQNWLVVVLLLILSVFVGLGCKSVDVVRYDDFLAKGFGSVLATAGLVFVSYGGVTKVASIAEEVKNPGKNIPRGMMLACFVVSVFYVLVIAVAVGVTDGDKLVVSYAPISVAAGSFAGRIGFAVLSIAALTAYVTTANGGILAASRSPLAMSRDGLLPSFFEKVSVRFHTPYMSVIFTCVFMILAIVFLDLVLLVKTASTLMIILFVLDNMSVIIMRESRIQSYRPGFSSPFYPYTQIVTIALYILLIINMGKIPLLITGGFILLCGVWYKLYVTRKVTRAAALMHIVERVTDKELKTVTLEDELRDILFQRDEIVQDRFDELIVNCDIIDVQGKGTAVKVFRDASKVLAKRLDVFESILYEKFLNREAEGSTVIEAGLAIPHIIVPGEGKFEIMLVRAVDGIDFPHANEPVNTIFVLAGSKDERNYHLRALMAIAQISQEEHFKKRWLSARGPEEMRNLLLLSKRKRDANQ